LWKKQFSGAAGPFTIELQPCDEFQYENFINSLKFFGLGTSLGGFESLIMPAVPHHLRSMSELPNEGRMVRLHIGLEDKNDLCADLAQEFTKLEK
jgi:cystathionine beta-lyase